MWSNDKNYIKRLKNKKEDALEFIVDKYLPVVKGTVSKIILPLNNKELIEECINDVFLSVWENSCKFNGEDEDFKKWIYKISRYKAIDYYRKEIRKKEIITDDIEIGESKSSEDEFLIKEEEHKIIKLINNLKPLDRDIFIMKFLLGMKAYEISEKLQMSQSAINNRIYRSKKAIVQKDISDNQGVI